MAGLVEWFKGFKGNPTKQEPPIGTPEPIEDAYYDIYSKIFSRAQEEDGEKEIPGSKDNPEIIKFLKEGSPKYKPSSGVWHDEIPWCAAFVGYVLKMAGLHGTGRADAVSYLKWGKKLDKPVKGCVMVLEHIDSSGRPNGRHHVTFFSHEKANYVYGYGGNQGNKVCLSAYDKREVMKDGYRGPA